MASSLIYFPPELFPAGPSMLKFQISYNIYAVNANVFSGRKGLTSEVQRPTSNVKTEKIQSPLKRALGIISEAGDSGEFACFCSFGVNAPASFHPVAQKGHGNCELFFVVAVDKCRTVSCIHDA